MRLKRRYVPDKPRIIEIDCGMGMTELRAEVKEIQAITMMPRTVKRDPAWKRPVIVGSLMAAAAVLGLSFTAFLIAPILFGALTLISLGWISFVAYANR